ncbi:GNAT family protein [Novosphingobium sp. Chol11]|uniref:GNAT family N-acetyltransferase n=1 Tax=Novosphingobium sp. Chol11 TaxID=1385763 RepID=UPI0025FBE9DE|nr:GNAT family protein [Novosphingobium sp. Chol11]
MIVETTDEDYVELIFAPRSFSLPDTQIAPTPVLQMLAEVAANVRQTFAPASWLIVNAGEVVGLCSVTRPPSNGVIDIGYGIAPSRQGRGFAGHAVSEIVTWAREAPNVVALTAETSLENEVSQRVLARNGFIQVGERIDNEDGPLICWRCFADKLPD